MKRTTETVQHCPIANGQRIADRYVVCGLLGTGSVGWVLKASDEALNGDLVALKLLYPHLLRDSRIVDRLRQEVVLARQLAHPNIVHVHDFEELSTGESFLSMEYVRGTNLAELLAERTGRGLPLDECVFLLQRIAQALQYAHERGIVHRDLKPSNILVSYDGRVCVSDFGLAKSFESDLGLTRTGETIGTPAYMSPEQFRSAEVTARSDIYSFGILAYELVCGKKPYPQQDYFALANAHLTEPLPPLARAGKEAPEWLAELLKGCCEKDPSRRPALAGELAAVLAERLPASCELRAALPVARKRRLSSRALSAVAALLSLCVFFGAIQMNAVGRNVQEMLAEPVYRLEFWLGWQLPYLRSALKIRGSLLDPPSVFSVLGAPEPNDTQLGLLLRIDHELRKQRRIVGGTPLTELRDSQGYTLLQRTFEAADRFSHPALLAVFTGLEVDTGVLDQNGETVVTATLKNVNSRLLFEQLKGYYRLSVNVPNQAGELPLHVAVRTRNYDSLNRLLTLFNANPNAFDRLDRSPIHLAAEIGDYVPIMHFASVHASLAQRDAAGRTPLMYVVGKRPLLASDRAVIAQLVKSTQSVNARDDNGISAIRIAAEAGNWHIVEFLAASGADVSVNTASGQSIAALAYSTGQRLVARDLLSLSCSPAAVPLEDAPQ